MEQTRQPARRLLRESKPRGATAPCASHPSTD
jgi:hypothetical protein